MKSYTRKLIEVVTYGRKSNRTRWGFGQGLAQPSLSMIGMEPVFYNMIKQGRLEEHVFGLWLAPNKGSEPAGELTFGGVNSQRHLGKLDWHPVTEKNYWTVAMDAIYVGKQPVTTVSKSAILDSGTTAIMVSTTEAEAIHAVRPSFSPSPKSKL